MKKPVKYKGKLKVYMTWPVYAAILLVVFDGILLVTKDYLGALLGLAFILIYVISSLIFIVMNKSTLLKSLIEFALDYAQFQKRLFDDFDIPYGILDENGTIIWLNKEFKKLLKKESSYRKRITSIFNDISEDFLESEEKEIECDNILYNDRIFRVKFKKMALEPVMEDKELFQVEDAPSLIAVYLFDDTQIQSYIRQIHDEQLVVGYIHIDNYDDSIDGLKNAEDRSHLSAAVENAISNYITKGNGIVRKFEKDKYITVFRYKFLEELKEDKFSILESVRSSEMGDTTVPVTLSIGIATGFETFGKNYEMAKKSIDLALGRSGNQVVLKEGEKTTYYDGKNKAVEKNTKVKVRVRANALKTYIEAADNVIIMGHKNADTDCLGSAIGIYRMAKTLGKHSNIILNNISRSLKPFVELFENSPEYEEDLFIRSEEAMKYKTDNTLLVIVDVHRAFMTECPELIDKCEVKVVIDHHILNSNQIEATLSYIEPYASSASEMVTEILQIIGDKVKLKAAEANALYAGIVIDTNHFIIKAGVRTFEAAAHLKKNGADVVKVHNMLRVDMNEYKVRSSTVENAEIYKDYFALTVCNGDTVENPAILGAQAANELLNIAGIKASFVLTEDADQIRISARSLDERTNVMRIMEKLGGGGHLANTGGAQLKGVTMEEAIEQVKNTLDVMMKEGEL